jgi:acyl-CoA synthetase (AMP-forming)/AMP-acid ligase II
MEKGDAHSMRSLYYTILEEKAKLFPDKVFIHSIDQNRSITYGQMYRLCNQIGHFLAGKGFKANDRVVLLTENSIENLIIFMGVLAYGATYCPLNVEVTEKIMGELLDKMQPRLVLRDQHLEIAKPGSHAGEWISFDAWNPQGVNKPANGEFFSMVAAYPETTPALPVCRREDFCMILHTSGTTSKPKGVIHTYGANVDQVEALSLAIGVTADDTVLEYRSFGWGSAQQLGFLVPLYVGATVATARKFSQSRFFDWLKENRITVAAGVPTTINMLLSRPLGFNKADFPHLRYITSSTAPLSVAQHLKFEEMYGIKIIQMYGMSEAGMLTANHPDNRKIGTVGRPTKYQEITIVDDSGAPCPPGAIGEIQVSGSQRSYGYLEEGGVITSFGDRRHKTGDVGFFDEDGFLHVTGRIKDLIIRGGVNVAPAEIDNILMDHPDVAEAATVGVPDPIYGEEVVCYIARKPGKQVTAEDLLAHCRLKLADFKLPKEILFVESIPKNDRGKIDRMRLIEEWKQSHKG